ncbi:unnamed protein product [Moneuplotes crassus]|uniref:Uncharacterized protein n=1 Tax=Euplotes crassus TaxID=5936 RepID=A0AAD1XR06_EUPCR|nr:unnamed protein product [Moneuplotes crassus]CAI2377355.1 unnamed protein product [Moneuplotes crassus]
MTTESSEKIWNLLREEVDPSCSLILKLLNNLGCAKPLLSVLIGSFGQCLKSILENNSSNNCTNLKVSRKDHLEDRIPKIQRFTEDFSNILIKALDINKEITISKLKMKYKRNLNYDSKTQDRISKTAQRRKIYLSSPLSVKSEKSRV